MKRSALLRRTPLRSRNDSIRPKHQAYYREHCVWSYPSERMPSREYRLYDDWLIAGTTLTIRKAWFYDGAFRDGEGHPIVATIWAERVPLPGRYGLSKRRAATLPGEQTARSFGSGWEGERATFLRLRELAGEITNLEHQKVFHLGHPALPGLDIPYASDASYIEDGRLVIEDTKGKANERFDWICRLWPWLAPAPLRIVKKGRHGLRVTKTIYPKVYE